VETRIRALFPSEFTAGENLITKIPLAVWVVQHDKRGLTANSTYAFFGSEVSSS
jgi:hypothetical protein